MSLFTGSCVALITPFTKDGVNYDALHKLIDFQIENGTDAILICGTTGEPATMTSDEKKQVISDSVSYINKRVPVIVGAGTNSTAASIANVKAAKDAGADAALIVTPYYNKATQKGLVAHYNAIGDSADLPLIVYNVPSRTGVNINADTMGEIAKHKNVIGIKEASGNIKQIVEISRLCNGKADLYSGNDDHIVPVMSCGGKGVISVLANVAPRAAHDIADLYLQGKLEESLKLQHKYNPLIDLLFCEVNPIPVKKAAELMGFAVGSPRMPLTDMEPANVERLKAQMQSLGLI
ncbi:MAG: 4-hydroxy-tetrahydrodipicolinate synthase [Clostridia bacterium]|nr:4-hydroxy-tetrahydrodipicolinate synthase [Clostridia bacterium]